MRIQNSCKIRGICGIYWEPADRKDYIEIELKRAGITEFGINLVVIL